jgi:hypothetical protein
VGDQPRQQHSRGVHQALDVGVHHRLPLVQVAALGGVDAEGQAGVVDEAAQGGEVGRQAVDGGLHGGAVAHVHGQRQHRGGGRQLGRQRLQAVLAAAGDDQLPAGGGKAPRAGLAETRGGAGDEQGGLHDVSSRWKAARRGAGNGWILLVRPAWINRPSAATLFSRIEQSPANPPAAREAMPSARAQHAGPERCGTHTLDRYFSSRWA